MLPSTPDVHSVEPLKPPKPSTLHQVSKWTVWLTGLGVGFYTPPLLLAPALQHDFVDALLQFVLGVLIYIVDGLILGLIAAGIVALRGRETIPIRLRIGLLISIIFGAFFGTYRAFAMPGSPNTASPGYVACTAANIEPQFARVMALHRDLAGNGVSIASLNKRVDQIWRGSDIDCTGKHPELTDRQRGEFLDIYLIGSADTAIVKYAAAQYKDSRRFVDRYFSMLDIMRPIAKLKGWQKTLDYDAETTPLIKTLDARLRQRGFKPDPDHDGL
jgi:hypothetical protein